jgi:purine-binding chemotaxis protein CheW
MMTAPHLVIRMGGALYALEAPAVRELFHLPELTPLAEAPRSLAGVLNFRGRVIRVIDLGLRLGLDARRRELSDAVVVVEHGEDLAGVLVHEVLDVREVSKAATDRFPCIADVSSGSPRLTRGVARVGDHLITLLDVEELLRQTDPLALTGHAGAADPEARFPHAPVEPRDAAVFRERARSLASGFAEDESEQSAPVAVIALNGEWFGVDLEWVREFADLREVTPVPCCPEHVVGTVNLRGEILTLVDLRGALSLPTSTSLQGAQMMVVQLGELRAGVVVDQVLDVVRLSAADLAPTPYSVRSTLEEHVAGMAGYRDRMLAILDLPGLFAREDWVVDAEP